ncbi:hypothetical protein DF053_18540 [Burkholderia cepacia]|nr:hypothetical protein DF057_24520 [Burkholderia cepacia]RQZ87266.1 hypothetical protein DF053_18540 [Burkholderia cepacia]
MARAIGKRGRWLDIIVIYHGCPVPAAVHRLAGARDGGRLPAQFAADLQQYRQDVAGLPRDRALTHNESSFIHTRERRTRPSS